MDRLDQMSSPLEVTIFHGNPHAHAPPGPGSIQEELVQDALILTEALWALSEGQLELFREALQQQLHPHQLYSDAPRRLLAAAGPGQAALLLLEALGPRCLATAGWVLGHIGRGDLGRRLLRPGPRRLPDETPLIRKVAEVAAFKHLLLASLDRLDEGELKRLRWELQFSFFQTGLPQACWGRLVLAGRQEVAQQLLGAFGRRCLEVAGGLFRDLGKPHLLPAPESSKSPQKGRDDVWPALTQKVGEMAASADRLLGALRFLSGRHLEDFKRHVLVQIGHRQRSPSFHHRLVALTDLQDAVLLMVAAHGQQAEQQAREVLQQLGRSDVAVRLSGPGGTGEFPLGHWTSDLIHTMKKVATMAAVKQLLVDVCDRLSPDEPRLVHFLKLELSRRNLVQVTSKLRPGGGSAELLDVMLETIGRLSVDVVRQVLLDTGVDRAYVLQNLPESSGGGEERHSVDDEEALSLEGKEKALESVGAVLSELSVEELDRLRWLLRFACFSRRIPAVPRQQLELAEPVGGAARLLVDWLGRRAVEVLREVLPDMSRADLVRKLPAAAPPPHR
ncbi:uncharacterized protein ACNS7B_018583 [Menidia menidia]